MQKIREGIGEYQLLSKYLHDRFANRLVLTFAQIEDLLGFPLPEAAWRQLEWWDSPAPGAHRSPQSEAWASSPDSASTSLCSVDGSSWLL